MGGQQALLRRPPRLHHRMGPAHPAAKGVLGGVAMAAVMVLSCLWLGSVHCFVLFELLPLCAGLCRVGHRTEIVGFSPISNALPRALFHPCFLL